MKNICKGPEPEALQRHRRGPSPSYKGLDKMPVRQALHDEQGGICCYCMGRIKATRGGMKIEHHTPQRHPVEGAARALDWQNLLGACPGGDGGPAAMQHCDTARGNAPLQLDPRRPIEHRFRYPPNGRVEIDEPELQRDIDAALRLNIPALKRARRAVLEGLKTALSHRRGTRSAGALRRHLRRFRERSARGDCFQPYCQVAVYYLEKKLR